ncbi:MAG: efflux transporter periplasmic adaptor subunit [Hyphomicrobiales bacterium]|nr:MAG: efflux transporter periplasmic adaptor subunit [Hyphomicrobiales bacterium]
MKNLLPLLFAAAVPLLVAGCNEEKAPKEPPVRPVLSVVASLSAAADSGFVGTVEPRFSTDLGFRVLGRMISRSVDVGDTVDKGAPIASLDASAYEFALQASKANLAAAKAQLANALASETRQKTLLERGVATQADVDAAEQARKSAEAAVTRAEADLSKAEEQLGYTQLTASFDGVVTAVGAEVGQVVSAGEIVVTLARLDRREAVVDIPENVSGVAVGSRFEMTVQAPGSPAVEGTVREIAPEADRATRSRRVRITLDEMPAPFRLGATVTARPLEAVQSRLRLPLSALLEEDGKSFVWVVDEAAGSVNRQSVTVGARNARSFVVVDGLEAGTRVVTAGVHSLDDGQKVRVGEGTR